MRVTAGLVVLGNFGPPTEPAPHGVRLQLRAVHVGLALLEFGGMRTLDARTFLVHVVFQAEPALPHNPLCE